MQGATGEDRAAATEITTAEMGAEMGRAELRVVSQVSDARAGGRGGLFEGKLGAYSRKAATATANSTTIAKSAAAAVRCSSGMVRGEGTRW